MFLGGKGERKPHRSIDAKKGSWYGFETIMKSILSIHDINEKCPSLGTPHCIAMITLQMFLELIELWRCVAFDGCLYEFFLQTCLPFVHCKYGSSTSADRLPSRFWVRVLHIMIFRNVLVESQDHWVVGASCLLIHHEIVTDLFWHCWLCFKDYSRCEASLLPELEQPLKATLTIPHPKSLFVGSGESSLQDVQVRYQQTFFLPRSCLTFRLEFLDQKKTQESPHRNDAPWILKQLKQKKHAQGLRARFLDFATSCPRLPPGGSVTVSRVVLLGMISARRPNQ